MYLLIRPKHGVPDGHDIIIIVVDIILFVLGHVIPKPQARRQFTPSVTRLDGTATGLPPWPIWIGRSAAAPAVAAAPAASPRRSYHSAYGLEDLASATKMDVLICAISRIALVDPRKAKRSCFTLVLEWLPQRARCHLRLRLTTLNTPC